MLKAFQIFCVLVLLTITQFTFAARPLSPPIEELLSSPDLTRVVVAVASGKEQPAMVKFLVSERISGESPDQLVLRLDEATFADVKLDQSYLLAWTDLRLVPLLRDGYEKDPDGPSVVKIRGLDTTAFFNDSAEIRFLFATGEQAADPGQEINALLALLQQDDHRSQDLAAMQFLLKTALSKGMDRDQVEALKKVLQRPELSIEDRNYLLQSALGLPETLSSPWLAEEFRKNIILHGTQYDLLTQVPGLVLNSARGLGKVGDKDDVELLSFLLYANNPGVAEAALESMNHFDPGLTRAKAELAINRGWVSTTTRRTLERYVKNYAGSDN